MKSRRWIIIASSAICAVAFWFLAIDLSWFIEECPTCLSYRDVIQYRIFTLPIHEQTNDHPTFLQRVATDVGVPCLHPKLTRWHKHRYWGLCICGFPCINVTMSIGDPENRSWYDDIARAKIKEVVRANPYLRDEFAERVLKNHDWEFFKAFVERVKILRNEKSAVSKTVPDNFAR